MAVRKINSNWYVDFRFNGRRYRIKSPFNTKKGAILYEQKMIQQLVENDGGIRKKNPLAREPLYKEFAEGWFDSYVLGNNKPAEQKKKRTMLDVHLVPAFGNSRLSSIHERDIESFKRDNLRKGYNPKTINNMLSTLRKSLDCAAQWGELNRIPTFTWLKVPKKDINVISERSIQALRQDRSEPLWNLMILIAIHTGMRIGEIRALRWKDVNIETGVVSVNGSMNVNNDRATTKNSKSRIIPLNYELRRSFTEEWEARKQAREAFLFNRGDGKPHSVYAASDALQKVVKRRLGIEEHITWHMFRHTFASTLAKRGVNIRVIQELLGHSSITMTERYSHIDMPSMQSAVQLLDYVSEDSGHYVGIGISGFYPGKIQQSQKLALL